VYYIQEVVGGGTHPLLVQIWKGYIACFRVSCARDTMVQGALVYLVCRFSFIIIQTGSEIGTYGFTDAGKTRDCYKDQLRTVYRCRLILWTIYGLLDRAFFTHTEYSCFFLCV
jgi:hypothetical protein